MPKPSEEIKEIWRKLLTNELASDRLSAETLGSIIQAIIHYLDIQYDRDRNSNPNAASQRQI